MRSGKLGRTTEDDVIGNGNGDDGNEDVDGDGDGVADADGDDDVEWCIWWGWDSDKEECNWGSSMFVLVFWIVSTASFSDGVAITSNGPSVIASIETDSSSDRSGNDEDWLGEDGDGHCEDTSSRFWGVTLSLTMGFADVNTDDLPNKPEVLDVVPIVLLNVSRDWLSELELELEVQFDCELEVELGEMVPFTSPSVNWLQEQQLNLARDSLKFASFSPPSAWCNKWPTEFNGFFCVTNFSPTGGPLCSLVGVTLTE